MKEQKEACLICGAELEYFTEAREQNCAICGDRKVTNACCKNGHFVCDACHMEQGIKELLQYGLEETSGNPIEIIQKWMGQEQIHMHGPEHHVLVGAARSTGSRRCGKCGSGEGLFPAESADSGAAAAQLSVPVFF